MEFEVIRSNLKTMGAQIKQNKLIICAPIRLSSLKFYFLKCVPLRLVTVRRRARRLGTPV